VGGRGSYSRRRAFLLWLCTFAGGAVTGAGLFLLGQVELVVQIRDRVEDLGFFTRQLGYMTFLWQGLDDKLALALADIPARYIEHSRRVGQVLAGLGLVGVALVLPWWLRRRWRR